MRWINPSGHPLQHAQPPRGLPPRVGPLLRRIPGRRGEEPGADGAAAVGEVVSGTQSPSLECGIGMGYVPVALAQPGASIEVEIRGRRWTATVVKKPIYQPSK